MAPLRASSSHQRLVQEWLSSFEHVRHRHEAPCQDSPLTSPAYSETKSTRFVTGTGASILSKTFTKILEEVDHELIFVTCFWARSESLDQFCELLKDLSEKALSSSSKKKIRVRLCLSSLSATQKLFDLRSETGHVYKQSSLSSDLRLPPSSELEGLDLQAMSIFQRPFCVMHPKFIIVDRRICFLPSCNVSWEDWFEGCIELRGSIVSNFLQFWQSFWMRKETFSIPLTADWEADDASVSDTHDHATEGPPTSQLNPIRQFISYKSVHRTNSLTDQRPVPALFLPSRNFRNPRFRPFPCQPAPPPPLTPLNNFTLSLLSNARQSIFLQTPNVTSPPVLAALRLALARKVNVHIITNYQLMTNEQLMTAGTTTPRCLHKLVQQYQEDKRRMSRDLESGTGARIGALTIEYYAPQRPQLDLRLGHSHHDTGYPTHSHVKLTVVDREVVLLGSGNMDRASWYTSQELGVALVSAEVAVRIAAQVGRALEGRLQTMYRSGDAGGGGGGGSGGMRDDDEHLTSGVRDAEDQRLLDNDP